MERSTNSTSGCNSTYAWFTRAIPAWSVCFIAVMLVFSFLVEPYGKGAAIRRHDSTTPWQLVLSVYTVILHIMSIVFPARVCYAMGDVIKHIKKETSTVLKESPKRRKTQTVRTEKGSQTFPVPVFVIILPAYKEDMHTLEETLRVLGAHPQARHSYHIYLAMEQKEEKSDVKAQTLINTFNKTFYKMSYTIHPLGIPGEAQGKSSNESWAAKQACKDYPDEAIKQDVIITTMDADTHLSPRYFQQIASWHIDAPGTKSTTMYVPPLVFDRNLHHVPLPVRTADLMWAGAGLSSLYSSSTVCIPTSVYSLPMTLVEHVGGWDTDPGSIGEDMHMYLKCFFALSGNLHTRIIYAAASQCNVSSDVKGISGYMDGINARYRQALRHMWGSLDTGFAVRQFFAMLERHRRAKLARVDLPLSAPKYVCDALKVVRKELLTACSSNWTAFYTSTGLHRSLTASEKSSTKSTTTTKATSDDSTDLIPLQPINKMNIITIFLRLFEAHFLPIHLAVILTTSSIFTFLTPSFLVPDVLSTALNFSGWCRLIGWSLMLVFFWRYESYHKLCVSLRQEEMRKAGMLDEITERDGFSMRVFQVAGLCEAGLFPIGGFIFGAIPACQAVLSHVFTDRLTYVVSLKPQFELSKRWKRSITP